MRKWSYLVMHSKFSRIQKGITRSHLYQLSRILLLFLWKQQPFLIGLFSSNPCSYLGKSHGWRSLEGYSHGLAEGQTRLSDFTFTFHFSLSRIGEGNGNPLQYSCLENPRDGGAWWAAVYGVAQSQTRLKWLSSSCSRYFSNFTEKNVFLLVQQYLLST